ncbi:MAG TPA: plastocyanin/azurin family copper-binding protein [Chloroflexia bacterium]|nr:plastocyanin/azurin family copper-binding protein [Chloroflexia bacterium]
MATFSLSRSRLALAGALLILAGLVAACGDVATPTTSVPPTTAASTGGNPGASDATSVTLNEWSIQPAAINVAAGHQKFSVTNSGKFAHNFTIMVGNQTMQTALLKAGESATLETDLAAGTWTTLCSIPGHKEKGMAGTVTVK